MDYQELMKESSYSLVEKLHALTGEIMRLFEEQDDSCTNEDYERITKRIEDGMKDLKQLCTCTERVITNEDNTKEAKEREDLYKKYDGKYFAYGHDEVVVFYSKDRHYMHFDSVSNCGQPMLQITSNCKYKKKVFTRTSYKEESGWEQNRKYFCEYLNEITKEEYDNFFEVKQSIL